MEFEKLKIVNKKYPNGIEALKGHIAICNDEFDVACVYTDFTGFEKYAKLFELAPEMFEMLKEIYTERINGGDFDTNKLLKLLTKITQ